MAWIRRLENRLLLALIALTIGFAGLVALGTAVMRDLMAAQEWRGHTLEVLADVAQIEAVLDGDRGLAYCALTGDTSYRSRQDAMPRFQQLREGLAARMGDNAAQLTRLTRLDVAMQLWHEAVVVPLERACPRRADGALAVGSRLAADEVARIGAAGQRLRADAYDLLEELRAAEQALLAHRTEQARSVRNRAERIGLLAAAALALLALAALWQLRRSTRRLTDSHERLRAEVQQRVRAEQVLRLNQTRTDMLLQSVQDGIVAFDAQGRVEWFNPAAEAVLRCPVEQAIGQPVAALWAPLAEYLPTRGQRPRALPQRQVLEARRQDGESFPLELSMVELWVDGQALYLAVLRDLTEQQRLERMKRDFVTVVSHELRTPLTSIRGALGLLCSGSAGELPAAAARMAQIARDNSERLVHLVGDILDAERLASGQMSIQAEILDACALAADHVRSMEGYARLHEVRLVPHAPPQATTWIDADAERLHQVLANLVSNAIRHSPRGGVVDLRVHADEDAVRFTVIDQGPGIPADFQDRLFTPFAQADTRDARVQGGSGLGLSIAKGLVERMGGTIGFESPSGGPTRFHVTLPRVRPPARDTDLGGTGLDDLIV